MNLVTRFITIETLANAEWTVPISSLGLLKVIDDYINEKHVYKYYAINMMTDWRTEISEDEYEAIKDFIHGPPETKASTDQWEGTSLCPIV